MRSRAHGLLPSPSAVSLVSDLPFSQVTTALGAIEVVTDGRRFESAHRLPGQSRSGRADRPESQPVPLHLTAIRRATIQKGAQNAPSFRAECPMIFLSVVGGGIV